MSTELEQQISNYFGWVETRAGVSLRAPETDQRAGSAPPEDRIATDESSRREFGVANLPPREPRRRRPWVVAAAASLVVVAGLAVMLSSAGDRQSPTSTPATDATQHSTSIDAELLPVRDPSLLPTVATPSIGGWDIEVTWVHLGPRFIDGGDTVGYRLSSRESNLELVVSSGQSALGGEHVELEVSGEAVEGSLDLAGSEAVLTWNTGTGTATGTTMSLFGPAPGELIEVAEALTFVDLPIVGATTPTFVDLAADRTVLATGTFDGVTWEVSDHPDAGALVVFDGRSPRINSAIASVGSTSQAVAVTTVSFDGHQVSAIEAGADTVSVSAVAVDGARIELPMAANATGDRTIAVAAVPSGRDAAVVAVTHADGSETLVGLPLAPAEGWANSRWTVEPG